MTSKKNKQVPAVSTETVGNIVGQVQEGEVSASMDVAASNGEESEKKTENSTENIIPSLVEIVVCAFEGTEERMQRIWEKNFPGDFKLLSVPTEVSIKDIVAECIADETVADVFSLVPANTFPCSEIYREELFLPIVYIYGHGKVRYDHRLPKCFDKSTVVELLADDSIDDETFCKICSERYSRPVKVGYSFGNFIMPVLRSTPCLNKVAEGILQYKYLACSPEGFDAIGPLLDTTILKS